MDDIKIFPVANWRVGPIPSMGIITICPSFLTHSMQGPEEANPGRYYALTPIQARDLIADLQKALAQIPAASTPPGGPRH